MPYALQRGTAARSHTANMSEVNKNNQATDLLCLIATQTVHQCFANARTCARHGGLSAKQESDGSVQQDKRHMPQSYVLIFPHCASSNGTLDALQKRLPVLFAMT